MKLTLATALALTLALPAFAQPSSGQAGMSGMGSSQAAITTADGAGVVTAVDAGAGTVSIHHGPIAKLGWPAMTMAFKADPPSILHDIKTGQQVSFTLMQMGGSTTLTAIRAK